MLLLHSPCHLSHSDWLMIVIHTITAGGPQQSTTILVYKVFSDGFVGQDLGSSSAQSVILLVVVGALTVIQFKYLEKRVHY